MIHLRKNLSILPSAILALLVIAFMATPSARALGKQKNAEAPAATVSPNTSGPYIVQHVSYTSPICATNDPNCCPAGSTTCPTPPFVGNSSVTFSTVTTKGNTIWVAATVSDYGGIHTISVTDTQGNTYDKLDQKNDGSPGSQSVAQFYAGDIKGGTDTITVNWTSDNYKGVFAVEVGGVTTAPLVGSNAAIQDGGIGHWANNVSSNGIAVKSTQVPGLLLALTMDTDGGTSDTGGTSHCAIPAGTGYTQVTQLWAWSYSSGTTLCNVATVEQQTVTTYASDSAGNFTTTYYSDPYVTVAAIFH
jgi:hypothetical protein